MLGCHGGEAVGIGYRYIDDLLSGHFLIRSLLDTDAGVFRDNDLFRMLRMLRLDAQTTLVES